MADLATQLYDLISAAGVVSFFPIQAPAGTAMPYAVWQVIASTPETTHDAAPAGLDDVLIQITAIAATSDGARTLCKTIRTALDGQTLADGSPIIIEAVRDQFEQTTDAYMAILEVRTFTDALA